jgi:hypothetical protein
MPEEQQGPTAEVEGKDLVIHLGGDENGGGDSTPPTDPKAQRLRSWANIIATTAALLTAVAAIFKPQDQTVNRNTYEQLKHSIEETNDSVKQNHDDTVAMHNYLAGYFAGNATFSLPPISTAPVKDAGAPVVTFVIPPSTQTQANPLPTIKSVSAPSAIPPFDSVAAKK